MAPIDWTRRGLIAGLGGLPALAWAAPGDFATALQAARDLPQLNALVILQGGVLRAAEAFRGPALDVPVNVKSVSKSLVSALVGISIDRGEIAGLSTPVAPIIGRDVPRRADPRVRRITVADMLSMRSGLREVSGAAYGAWVGTRFWIYEALSKPMVADPGTEYLYSTASYHVLGAVLSKAAKQDLHRLAQDRLGAPLGLTLPPWTKDPQGRFLGGNDMRVSPLGMARFGELYRVGGLWEGVPVLTQDWIAQSWTAYAASKETGHGYGFGWFLWQVGGAEVFYARGWGGQMIFVVPSAELVVAITSALTAPARLDGHLGALYRLLEDHILPAA